MNRRCGLSFAALSIVLTFPGFALSHEVAEPSSHFAEAGTYTTTVAASGDAADVYYPKLSGRLATLPIRFPVVVLLQGAFVDKHYYAKDASAVARYGFIVIVPNHSAQLGPTTALLPAESVINDGFAQVKADGADPTTAIYRRVDDRRLGLLGHSLGGVAALDAIAGVCQLPLCAGAFTRPPELAAAALYGTNDVDPNTHQLGLVDTSAVPTALVQGSVDGNATPADAAKTYAVMSAPRALITIFGANHFGITDVDAPAGAIPDGSPQTIDQATANQRISEWSALFLRAHLYDDPTAIWYIYAARGSADGTVSVQSNYRP